MVIWWISEPSRDPTKTPRVPRHSVMPKSRPFDATPLHSTSTAAKKRIETQNETHRSWGDPPGPKRKEEKGGDFLVVSFLRKKPKKKSFPPPKRKKNEIKTKVHFSSKIPRGPFPPLPNFVPWWKDHRDPTWNSRNFTARNFTCRRNDFRLRLRTH